MSPAPDPDPARTAARRAIARSLHPDLGGDPAAYLEAMAALEDAPTDQPHPGRSVTVRRTRWSRARSGLRGHRRRWVAHRRRSRYFEL